ncbi:xylulokinase [Arenibaculum pallidiluteum]|uniref:xylulokinase n=1 Tax=Arenibaculum pallidiluteum TaxID=2812559 RepID=UPI001A97724D|nr:xylulokinase [Arenibaculum pallidiluteum]
MYLGIDIGTSGVKALLVDGSERIVATATSPLEVSRPHEGWSEQNPEDWWAATLAAVDAIRTEAPAALAEVAGIGLSGQMHGATLLGEGDAVLRPCILWNDGRSAAECREMEAACPDLHAVAGNLAMPGFTAPKLLWVRRHEPEVFARIRRVLLPKAYVRLRLTGEAVEEMSDAAGTLWLDVGRRDWSDALLAATGLDRGAMPRLVEGTDPSGTLRAELASRWGMRRAPVVAGGGGDNAATAVGLGAVHPGDAFVSLGTSGVLWATTGRFAPNPAAAVHAFCHAVPGMWHQMGVILSAASALGWWAQVAGRTEGDLLAELPDRPAAPSGALFLPYLSGERTPHNDASARGAFLGLAHGMGRPEMTQAVLEGVAFAVRDALDALRAAGTEIRSADVVGGGSRSRTWIAILASVLDLPLNRLAAGEVGAALGAARLGRLAATGEAPSAVCLPPERVETIEPDPALSDAYSHRLARYRALYPAIQGALS